MRKVCLFLLCLHFLIPLVPPFLSSQAPEERRWKELSEREKLEWLETHREDDEFFKKLMTLVRSLEDPRQSIDILERFLPVIENTQRRYEALLYLAGLDESLGELASAQVRYQSAASIRRSAWDYRALLSSALLLIELGDYDLAELQLRRIGDRAEPKELQNDARIQYARLLAFREKTEEAGKMISLMLGEESLSPRSLYLMYTLALHVDMREEAAKAKQRLLRQFPSSPEAGIVSGLVRRAPSVEETFGLLHPKGENRELVRKETEETNEEAERVRAIQTGSFRDRENAEHLLREMNKRGLEAQIEDKTIGNKRYFRVVVPVKKDETAQKVVLQLKGMGFEGIPLYYEQE